MVVSLVNAFGLFIFYFDKKSLKLALFELTKMINLN